MKNLITAACAAALCVLAPGAFSQAFPVKPVRVIVAFPPGGSVDLLARYIAPKMAEHLGQPFVVENRQIGRAHV